jgi:endoglucanase
LLFAATTWLVKVAAILAGSASSGCDPGMACEEGMYREAGGCTAPTQVMLNTVGFPSDARKQATVLVEADSFEVRPVTGKGDVFRGELSEPQYNEDTDQQVRVADFSELTEDGTYVLEVEGAKASAEFRIDADPYRDTLRAAMLGFYGQRCGFSVGFEYGQTTFEHAACHEQDASMELADPGSGDRRDGTGGWHDAGDYGKYVVNGAFSLGVLLQAWEQLGPQAFEGSEHLSDEDSDGLPALLAEARHELDWLLKMQLEDGRVSHQIRPSRYEGAIMPDRDSSERFFSTPSTAATADLVAVMAQAARAYEPYDIDYAGRCLDAAQLSYSWLAEHPDVRMDANHEDWPNPTYQTSSTDDLLWALAELWRTTDDAELLETVEGELGNRQVPSSWDWSGLANLAVFTYVLAPSPRRDPEVVESVADAVTQSADALVEASQQHGYGRGITQYAWGSNGAVARACMNLVVAFRLTDDRQYLDTCARQLDFLLGRNAFGRSQVTGVGDRPPRAPHHRPSQASGQTWPGLLVGGLNYASQDNPRVDEDTLPGLAWFDESDDYFTNEVAINWNAALVYALAAIRTPLEGET